ncbi:MAG: DUF92 domain-containing protein [Candidatus Methanomethylophilaceae archaeon]|nr:DUF92 domain-containing protein [Candidatus Methanomethylophilaceae archaeon]
MPTIEGVLISVILSVILALITYRTGLLTLGGSVSAASIAVVIGALGSVYWLILLVVFAVLGFAATKAGFSKKRKMGVQEGEHGERNFKNILGVAIPPAVFAVLNTALPGNTDMLALAFIATVCVAASDTAASELGVRDPNVWLITTFKRVPQGTDGGISVKGTLISLIASFAVAAIGYILVFRTIDAVFVIPAICGMIGCIADSYIGATIETWGWVSKYANNCITGILGGVMAVIFCMI